MGELDGSGSGAAAPELSFCLGTPRPARSALFLLLLLSCWAPQKLLVRARSPSPQETARSRCPWNSSAPLAVHPVRRRKRPSWPAPGRRGAGGQGRQEKGGLVRAPAGRTHTPFSSPGAGQADAAEFPGTGTRAIPQVLAGQGPRMDRWGARGDGGGAQGAGALNSALSRLALAVLCVPL